MEDLLKHMHGSTLHRGALLNSSSYFGVVQEDALLLLAHEKHGNKWIEIAKMVGGRSVAAYPLISCFLSAYVSNHTAVSLKQSKLKQC